MRGSNRKKSRESPNRFSRLFVCYYAVSYLMVKKLRKGENLAIASLPKRIKDKGRRYYTVSPYLLIRMGKGFVSEMDGIRSF